MNSIEFAAMFCATIMNLSLEKLVEDKRALQCTDKYVRCFGAQLERDKKTFAKNYDKLKIV